MSIEELDIDCALSSMLHGSFDEMLENIREEYNREVEQVKRLRKRIEEWNKDEEIQEARRQAEFYRANCLCQLSEKESSLIKNFREKHYTSCKNGSTYIYEIVNTGIGSAISIKCPVCGQEENVTDYDTW